MTRIGIGYDIHRLVEDRALILGGVEIPFERGLLGHSDADVVLHAIGDALLGTLALGDLGSHFPDTDPRYKGVSSLELLKFIFQLLLEKNVQIENIDVTLIAQAPKLAPYREKMRSNISAVLNTSIENISIKFTTHDGVGEIGKGEAMAAHAVVLVQNIQNS
ncbi:MAG: 2-C-methyl-D-erythritol 2,4-cyclodiphosphate synthase [Gammaproteobacteria bacterium]|nr:2-C-methyl-D-erythritol 2,4-cyclodiphosphate synthase [Gammaproteobacteria bacterium]